MNALERLKITYQETLDNIRTLSKNLDFAQLNVALNCHSGPEGCLGVSVKDVLAQLPALFTYTMTDDKNIGVLPLVPYIFSLKPQENGDISFEVNILTLFSEYSPFLVDLIVLSRFLFSSSLSLLPFFSSSSGHSFLS
jgi:hypothetical protein